MDFNIEKILLELSYRIPNGMPDVKNSLHIIELQSLLTEMNYPKEFIEGLLEKLRTYADNPQNRKLNRVGDPWGSEGDKDQDTDAQRDDTTSDDIMDKNKVPFKGGKTVLNVGGIDVPIDAGKGSAKFRKRWALMSTNSTFRDNAQHFTDLANSLNGDPPNLKQAAQSIQTLQDAGVQIQYNFIKKGKKPNQSNLVQIRVGSAPFWTSSPIPESDRGALADKIAELEQLGLSKQKTGTSDSSDYKPDTFFDSSQPENQKTLDDMEIPTDGVREDIKKSQFADLGTGTTQVCEQTAATVKSKVPSKPPYDPYSQEEAKGLHDYANALDDPNRTAESVAQSYQALLKTSINRPNEIHKNFGEIHAAVMLAFKYPDATILMPTKGNATLSDVVVIKHVTDGSGGDTTHIVVEEAVKAAGHGVPSSVVSVTSGLTYKSEFEEDHQIMQAIMTHATKKGFKSLGNEDDPNTQQMRKYLNSWLSNTEVLNAIKSESSNLEGLLGKPLDQLENLSTVDLMKIATRNTNVARAIFDQHIKDKIDCEATGEKLAVTETGMNGSIKEHPVECDALKIAGPKRQGEVVTMSLAK